MAETDWVDDPHPNDADWVDDEPVSAPAMSALRKGLQGATAGFSDEAAGLVEGAGRAFGFEGAGGPMKDIKKSSSGPTLDWEIIKDAYQRARDKERADLERDSRDNPEVSGVAELAGAVASPLNKIMPSASLAKSGAVIGGITGLGQSEANDAGEMLMDAGKGAAFGGTLGYGAQKAMPYLEKGANFIGSQIQKAKNSAGEIAKDTAEKLAFKSTGATLKDFRAADGRDQINDIGRMLLDKGIVKAGDSVDDIASKTLANKGAAGSRLEEIYSNAEESLKSLMSQKGFDPVRDKNRILNAAKAELGDTVGSDAALQKLSDHLETIGLNQRLQGNGNVMSPKAANDVKGGFDEQINYSRNPISKEPASEKAFTGARREMNKIVDESINELGGGEASAALKAANKDFGLAAEANKIAQDRVNRNAANKMFGLTDTITAGAGTTYGAMTGDWKTAVAGMALKKGLDKVGTSTLAVMADKVGKQLLKSPSMQKIAVESPQAFGAMVYNLVQKMEERGGSALPKAADKQEGASIDKDSILNKLNGSKYGAVLQNAAQNGDDSFGAAHFVLSQRDPEYRRTLEGD
ncbi:hypothetical protein [Bdellovibrio sp. HCB288]|uniref:hypothetical protein n=1 Tax=Bdellovibrio sp. HCB288 TaxID=3394355 RepID=UPI0039B3FBD9